MRSFLGRRGTLYLALAVVVAIGIGLWVAHRYISSHRIASEVASRLAGVLGMPVQIDHVDVELNRFTLHHVQLYQPGSNPVSQPWAVVENADVDVSLWEILQGKTYPRHITLRDGTIALNLDQLGHPHTPVPPPHPSEPERNAEPPGQPETVPIPSIDIEGAKVVLRQPGHPDTLITGIQAHVHGERDRVFLSGRVLDPFWGNWFADASMHRQTLVGSGTLKTVSPIHVTDAMLDKVLFVYPGVLKEVSADGYTPVELSGHFDLRQQILHYQAVFEPKNVTVYLPSIDLRANHVRGQVVIDDSILHLRDLRGDAAGGQMEAKGDMNFFRTGVRLTTTVTVRDVDMDRLPRIWGLPREVSGRLCGSADLQTAVVNDTPLITGEGHGMIHRATLLKMPINALPLTMYADGAAFRFALR
jgi:hypothetical protein